MAVNDDEQKPGVASKYVQKRTGPDDPEYGPYKPRNKGTDYFNPDMVGEYKNDGRSRPIEAKPIAGGASIPYDLLKQATDLYKESTIVREMGAGITLIQMLRIYERNVATTESAFSRMYKDRPSTHETDIKERESVAKEMHAERAQARDFLDYIKEGMQNHGLLSTYEINTFNNIVHSSRSRRER